MERCNLQKIGKNFSEGQNSLRYENFSSIACYRDPALVQDGWQMGETSGIPDPSCETMSFLSKLFVPNVSSSRPRFQPKRGVAGIPAQASQQRMDEESWDNDNKS